MVDDPGGTPATQKITISALIPSYGASKTTVATSETTTSTSYTDLSTGGPAATVTIGQNGMALVNIAATTTNSNALGYALMAFAISGATTVAASDTYSTRDSTDAANQTRRIPGIYLVTGLTPGSNTFTAKYRVLANTGTFVDRYISVTPL